MSDESRHRVHRGRPLRTVQRTSTEARRRSNARKGSAANRKPTPEFDMDAAITRLRAMLDARDVK